jgi:hypothetical protein
MDNENFFRIQRLIFVKSLTSIHLEQLSKKSGALGPLSWNSQQVPFSLLTSIQEKHELLPAGTVHAQALDCSRVRLCLKICWILSWYGQNRISHLGSVYIEKLI